MIPFGISFMIPNGIASSPDRQGAQNAAVRLGLVGQVRVEETGASEASSWEWAGVPGRRARRRGASALLTHPIRTIAFGVFWGMLLFAVVAELWRLGWNLIGALLNG